jgi:hypothetical protein
MAQIVIEVPDEVYQSLKALAASKGISFEDFCKAAFAAGFMKKFRKKFKE